MTLKKYLNDRISPNLIKVCKWAIDKITRVDPYSGITQNQSESMNKLLKSLNKWKEAPVDVVVLSFLQLQQYYIKEISRGRAGLGNYNLRSQYISAKIDLSSVTSVTIEGNNVTENPYRKSVTPVTTESNNVTENPYRKSVTPVTKDSSRDVAGPVWLRVGNTTLKDEEKSIFYLPNAWLNDRIVDAVQEILKRQFPHIWSLDTYLKASN